jgi:hypothetical protein
MQSMINNPYDRTIDHPFTRLAGYQFVDAWHPGIAWAVILTAGIYLYSALKWDRAPK